MKYKQHFDCLVIGGGHAGTEAALAAARMGAKTLLVTHNLETLGQMSCNPAIGGIGKGHLTKEVDALGGGMARAIDQAGIHFRTLNARKGPAVRATRAQADRDLYRKSIRRMLERQPQLTLLQQGVDDVLIQKGRVRGIRTQIGLEITASTVVLTAGTFLGGKIHVGRLNIPVVGPATQPSLGWPQSLEIWGWALGDSKRAPPRVLIGAALISRGLKLSLETSRRRCFHSWEGARNIRARYLVTLRTLPSKRTTLFGLTSTAHQFTVGL